MVKQNKKKVKRIKKQVKKKSKLEYNKQKIIKNPKKFFCPACIKTYCFDHGLKRHLIKIHSVPSDIYIDDSYKLDMNNKKNKKKDKKKNKKKNKRQNKKCNNIENKKLDNVTKKQINIKNSILYDYLICPITQQIYYDPVTAVDGITYEKSEITRWLKKNNTSPITRKKISKKLYPSFTTKNIVDIFIKNNPQYAEDIYKPDV